MQLTYTFLGPVILSSVPPSRRHIVPNMGLRVCFFGGKGVWVKYAASSDVCLLYILLRDFVIYILYMLINSKTRAIR
jgi:hypothetical protein